MRVPRKFSQRESAAVFDLLAKEYEKESFEGGAEDDGVVVPRSSPLSADGTIVTVGGGAENKRVILVPYQRFDRPQHTKN